MMSTLSYPTDDMSSVSKSLTPFIDEQLKQHTALFLTNEDSYVALLTSIASMIPNAGSNVETLRHELQNYHQQYVNCYQALRELALKIDAAAQAMSQQDAQTASTFE